MFKLTTAIRRATGRVAVKPSHVGAKAAVLAAVVIAIAACQGSPPGGPGVPGPRTTSRPSSHGAAWKDFVAPAAMSGCPSSACSDILAQVQVGAGTRSVPQDLTPSIQDASKDLLLAPDGGDCSELPVSGLETRDQPCVFSAGVSATAPMMVLIGNSRALMWSRTLLSIATQLGYRFSLVAHEGCSMPRVANPPRTGAVSAAECKGWEDAAINWINQQNPAVVFVASGPDLSEAVTPDELTAGYAATLDELKAPARKVFVFGEVPRLDQDPPNCLAAHSSDALKCAAPPSVSASGDEQQAVLKAAQQSGAAYVNVTPWLCTEELCPAIVGHYLAYRDQRHLTSTFTEALSPVLQQAINIGHA